MIKNTFLLALMLVPLQTFAQQLTPEPCCCCAFCYCGKDCQCAAREPNVPPTADQAGALKEAELCVNTEKLSKESATRQSARRYRTGPLTPAVRTIPASST